MKNSIQKLFIVMPAYNEADNIDDVVKQWHIIVAKLNELGTESKLVIANDGSKDTTWEKLQQLSADYHFLVPLDKKNSGHGATLLYLYRYSLQNGADFIFQTDSDGQTVPDEFWNMWGGMENLYDFQIGYRNKRQDGWNRIFVTKVLKSVVKMTFNVSVTDANTPFRLMKSDSLKNIINLIPDDFFLSNVALSAIAVKKKYKIRWIPVTFRPRQGGVNSINLKKIFLIGVKALSDFYKINKNITNKI